MSGEWLRIAPDVRLGQNVRVYAFVNLYGCEVGDDSRIGTFVEIGKGARHRAPREDLQPHLYLRGCDH